MHEMDWKKVTEGMLYHIKVDSLRELVRQLDERYVQREAFDAINRVHLGDYHQGQKPSKHHVFSPADSPSGPQPTTEPDENARIYPCLRCEKLRTKAEGGTTFSLCEVCRDKRDDEIRVGDEVECLEHDCPVHPQKKYPVEGTKSKPREMIKINGDWWPANTFRKLPPEPKAKCPLTCGSCGEQHYPDDACQPKAKCDHPCHVMPCCDEGGDYKFCSKCGDSLAGKKGER